MGRLTLIDPGERAVRFVNALTHTKGDWAGKRFALRPWQERIIRALFGTLNPDGTRQYRTCYVEMPRKSGKTELAAALALFMLLGDREQGGEIYGAAVDLEQAGLAFDVAAQMIRNDPDLDRLVQVVPSRRRIVSRETGSVYRAIPADAPSAHGYNASAVLYDELHAAPNRELWDVLTSSMGTRRQPLTFVITTAGYDRDSICWELHRYAERVRDGIITDPTFLPVLYGAPAEVDWLDEAVWRAANPALGDFRSLDEMRMMAAQAREIPARQNAFRRLYLCQWCLALDTLVAMADGTLKRADALCVGDRIVSFDESPRMLVLATVKRVADNGVRPIYRVTTKRGRSLGVTGNHLFWVRLGRPDRPRYAWLRADELRVGSRVGVALEWPALEGERPLDADIAKFLGVMVGDGSYSGGGSPRVTKDDPGVIEFCRVFAAVRGVALSPVGDHPAHHRFSVPGSNKTNTIARLLRDHGLDGKTSHTKRVPSAVMSGGPSAWAGFMAGYLDTDGHVAERSVIWSSVSPGLLGDCQHLLAMLGIQSGLRPIQRPEFPIWRLEVHAAEGLERLAKLLDLSSARKRDRLLALAGLSRFHGPASQDRSLFDSVTTIETVEPAPTLGVEVEGTHTHVTNGLITHNTEQATRALAMERWDAGAAAVDLEALRGRPCFAGLDLASSGDVAAFVLLFPPASDETHYQVVPQFWVPAENLEHRARDAVSYRAWVEAGLIEATEGNVIDYDVIRARIREDGERFEIREITYDRWGAVQLATQLQGDGFTLVPFGQGFASMAAPTREFLSIVASARLAHGGHPVLRWMASCLALAQDAAGNLKPDRHESMKGGGKIDGIVALVMALGRAMVQPGPGGWRPV